MGCFILHLQPGVSVWSTGVHYGGSFSSRKKEAMQASASPNLLRTQSAFTLIVKQTSKNNIYHSVFQPLAV